MTSGFSKIISKTPTVGFFLRHAFYYLISTASIALFLTAFILANNYIDQTVQGFSFWVIPIIVAVVVVFIGRWVWWQFGETDRLKYEFITVATHKLRTPLTHIHWMIPELLIKAGLNTELRDGLRRIDDANNRIIELTNVLMEAAHSDSSTYEYQSIAIDVRHLAWESIKHFHVQITEKKLSVRVEAGETLYALGDAHRLAGVVEVLIENAVTYTPENGTVVVRLERVRKGIRFSVTDTGIGIKSEDKDRLFSQFFRTDEAKTTDTEGVGIGLSLSKSIIRKLHGDIGVDSAGLGKGSTFWFVLPEAPATMR